MCETTTHRPVFKGVVVCTVTILMAACMICPSSVSGRNLPYCVYVDRIQEIKCGCENFALNTTFPNSDIFVSLPASSIERQDAKKIKGFTLDTCDKLHLKLDLTPLPQPFLRWRIQNVKEVIIESIVVRPNDSVNFWFDHITNNLTLKGEITCPECKLHIVNNTVDRTKNPEVRMQIVNSGSVTFANLAKDPKVNLAIKGRDLSNLTIIDSYFSFMKANGIEVFNTPNVDIVHSEFHDCDPGFITFNRLVKNVNIQDCLMEANAVTKLSTDDNATSVRYECTVSPLHVANEIEANNCTENFARYFSAAAPGIDPNTAHGYNPGVETTGAIMLALVSSFILIVVVLYLYMLHRQGKLDQYL